MRMMGEELLQPSLVLDEDGLALVSGDTVLRGDLSTMIPRLRRGNIERELLVRAAKIKGAVKDESGFLSLNGRELRALDATAGLGEDSLLLAAAGFTVDLYEYDTNIAALLEDSLLRAASFPELAEAVSRMKMIKGNSIEAMKRIGETGETPPDVILLDPMFPERTKSALVKKKMQMLQKFEKPCANEEELLSAAIGANPIKVIVKRPIKGPHLAVLKPNYSISGKTVRYDIIT